MIDATRLESSMKRISTILLSGCLTTTVLAGPTTVPLYENLTSVTNVPQIDALAFANYGSFTIQGFIPIQTPGLAYDFMNTRTFYNEGEMVASPGFLFDTIDDFGWHSPAERFENANGGLVQALAGGLVSQGGAPSVIRIHAADVVNRGTLLIEADGLLEIQGDHVDLRRSAVGAQAILFGSGFHSTDADNPFYQEDEGVTDDFWGHGEQDPRFLSSSIITSFRGSLNAQAPLHAITNSVFNFVNSFPLNDPLSFVHTNELDPTNWVVDIVLVGNEDPYMNTQVNFFASSNPTNLFTSPAVQLQSNLTNVLAGNNDSVAFYLVDRMAAETNFYNLTNIATQTFPYRPVTLEWTRNLPLEFALGEPPNYDIRSNLSDLVYYPGETSITNVTTNYYEVPVDPDGLDQVMEIVTNIVTTVGHAHDLVTNIYSASGVTVTNLAFEVPDVPNASITNAVGRVELKANTLNLDNTRIRGEGHVTIATDHLVSSKNAVVDVASLYYDLGSTNGELRLQSLVLPEAQRLAGNMQAWSGVWTNTLIVVTNAITNLTITNIVNDPDTGEPVLTITNDPGTNIITTNNIRVGIHVLMLDASQMLTRYPTFVNGLIASSTNVYISDLTRVLESLELDGETLTVDEGGSFYVGDVSSSSASSLRDWTVDHFPNLVSITNNGMISVPNLIYMGTDRDEPYETIVVGSAGTNAASGHLYEANEFYNSGLITSSQAYLAGTTNLVLFPAFGPVSIEADYIEFNGGRIESGGNLTLKANQMKLRHSTNSAPRRIVLDVSQSLVDSGGEAQVQFGCGQGIEMVRKPQESSLLGTTIALGAAQYQLVSSTWPADDVGAVPAGYTNNLAIGRLVIDPAVQGTLSIAGAGDRNGMYVDYLEFGTSAQADLEGSLIIEPNLTVYFSDSNLDYATLTDTFPDRLVWISDFAGPNSSVPVLLPNGQTIRVSRGFRNSPTIDSDADGIANGSDISPFDGATITEFDLTAGMMSLTWRAAPDTTYQIEVTDAIPFGDWSVIREYTHSGTEVEEVSIEDTIPAGTGERYYRVSYNP